MNYRSRVLSLFVLAAVLLPADSRALPRDELATLCQQPGIFNLQVVEAGSGERFIYWCDSGVFEPCPGNVCQSGEGIEIDGIPDTDPPWGPECPPEHVWNPFLKRCVRLTDPPGDPNQGGGGGNTGNSGDCKSIKNMLESHCVADFKPPPDPVWIRAKTRCCLTTEKCLEQWDKKERDAGFTRNGRCNHCLDQFCKSVPKDPDIGPEDYKFQCNRLLTEQMERVAKFWGKDPKCRIVTDPVLGDTPVLEEPGGGDRLKLPGKFKTPAQ